MRLDRFLYVLCLPLFVLAGCSKTTISGHGSIQCLGNSLHDPGLVITEEESGESYQVEVNDNGTFLLEDLDNGLYRFDFTAYDSTGTFSLLQSSLYRTVPDGSLGMNFNAMSPPMWQAQDIEIGASTAAVRCSGYLWGCGTPGVLNVYVSETDPATWDHPNDFYSEAYLVQTVNPFEITELLIPFPADEMYLAFEVQAAEQYSRTAPRHVRVTDVPPTQIPLQTLVVLEVGSSHPRWIEVHVDEPVSCIIEYFDFDANGSSGRDLLVSAYSGDTAHTYFERRPLRKPDGTPAMAYKTQSGKLLLKAEVAEGGRSGSFGFYVRRETSFGSYGLTTTVDLKDFHTTHKRYAEELQPGTYTLSAYETAPDQRAVAYHLVNETSGEVIAMDARPSEDPNMPTTHSFTLNAPSQIQLTVVKAYWGDFDNEVHFSLD